MEVVVGSASGLHRLGTTSAVALAGTEIRGLDRGQEWWALWGDGAVYRSTNGHDWKLAAPVPEWPATCIKATPNGVLVGTAEAHVLVAGSNAITSFDRVKGREGWYTPWGGPPDTRSISFGPDATLYANVHVGGIPRSRDGGRTWEPTIDVDSDVHQVMAHPTRDALVFAATAYGLAVTEDGGESWRFETDGLHAHYARAVAVAGDTLLLTVSRGPRGGQAAVYRKPLEGDRPFERCRQGLPEWFDANIDTHCLAASEGEAAFGTRDGRVFTSSDAGASWNEAASGLPSVRCLALEH